MTDTIKITNIKQLTYPDFYSDNGRDLAEQLADLPEDGKRHIAEKLQTKVPSGQFAFKLNWPSGVEGDPCYFGHVRYIEQYDPYRDEILGRMDIGYGDEVKE